MENLKKKMHENYENVITFFISSSKILASWFFFFQNEHSRSRAYSAVLLFLYNNGLFFSWLVNFFP